MSGQTSIEWTDRTWNPLTGCTKVSPGCDHCYAKTMHERFHGPGSFDTITLHPDRLTQPLRWRAPRADKPSLVFVNSMSDLFHQDVPDEYIAKVFAVMNAAYNHTFQVLTKRHARMRSLLSSPRWPGLLVASGHWDYNLDPEIPGPNVWLGVSVESQRWADIRIPALLDTPAAVRFLSCEPLLGSVDLKSAALRPYERQQGGYWEYGHGEDVYGNGKLWVAAPPAQVDWVIVGGESGPGARPMHPDWARSLRDQCVAAAVPFLFKQWGAWSPDLSLNWGEGNGRRLHYLRQHLDGAVMDRVGKKAAGRVLDGRTWDEYPAGAA